MTSLFFDGFGIPKLSGKHDQDHDVDHYCDHDHDHDHDRDHDTFLLNGALYT